MIRARPTTYNSVRFRSRLEAKWAAFFDLAGWQWEYEPVDTAGWVPDFVLRGARENTWVEVKPIEWVGQSIDSYARQARAREDLRKVWEQPREALILGLYPVPVTYDEPFLGIIANDGCHPEDAAMLMQNAAGIVDFHGTKTSNLRISGQPYPKGKIADWALVGDLWRRAGALTQWRAA